MDEKRRACPVRALRAHSYEEPYHFEIVVTASNGRQRGELVIHSTPEAHVVLEWTVDRA